MAGSAEALLRASEDPEVRRIATLVLVRVYLWQQRLADAERIVDKALAEGSGRGGASAAYTINLLHAKSVLASERGDWPRVHALTSKIIAIAERGQISELARRIRMERAAACRGMGKPLHACVDLLVSAAMARTSSHFVHAFLAAQDASGLAVSLGVPRVAAVLQLWSMIALLHGLSAGALVGRAVDTAGLRAAGETELAERLDALGRWIAEEMPGASAPAVQGKLVEFGREFQEMFDVREAELRSQGIDAMDPMTWGVAEEPPVAHAEA